MAQRKEHSSLTTVSLLIGLGIIRFLTIFQEKLGLKGNYFDTSENINTNVKTEHWKI